VVTGREWHCNVLTDLNLPVEIVESHIDAYASIISMKTRSLPALPCLCGTLRRTSRALTQAYEEALRPTGLRATQFTILQFLSLAGEVTQGEMGEMLAIDSTTLTRSLGIMVRHRWIGKKRGKDRREWRLRLLVAGKSKLATAKPYWKNSQEQLLEKLGIDQWNSLLKLSNEATNAVTNQGASL
jgi:DNA-binding MarR family transcriptional regulator